MKKRFLSIFKLKKLTIIKQKNYNHKYKYKQIFITKILIGKKNKNTNKTKQKTYILEVHSDPFSLPKHAM